MSFNYEVISFLWNISNRKVCIKFFKSLHNYLDEGEFSGCWANVRRSLSYENANLVLIVLQSHLKKIEERPRKHIREYRPICKRKVIIDWVYVYDDDVDESLKNHYAVDTKYLLFTSHLRIVHIFWLAQHWPKCIIKVRGHASPNSPSVISPLCVFRLQDSVVNIQEIFADGKEVSYHTKVFHNYTVRKKA